MTTAPVTPTCLPSPLKPYVGATVSTRPRLSTWPPSPAPVCAQLPPHACAHLHLRGQPAPQLMALCAQPRPAPTCSGGGRLARGLRGAAGAVATRAHSGSCAQAPGSVRLVSAPSPPSRLRPLPGPCFLPPWGASSGHPPTLQNEHRKSFLPHRSHPSLGLGPQLRSRWQKIPMLTCGIADILLLLNFFICERHGALSLHS